MTNYLKSLFIRSAFIQKKIDEEYKAKSPNWFTLTRLKKLRLKTAERLYQVGGQFALHLLQGVSQQPPHTSFPKNFIVEGA